MQLALKPSLWPSTIPRTVSLRTITTVISNFSGTWRLVIGWLVINFSKRWVTFTQRRGITSKGNEDVNSRNSQLKNLHVTTTCLTHYNVYFLARQPPVGRAPSLKRFLGHTQRRTTVGRTSMDELSARRRGLYLKSHNIHSRQTSMPPVGFELTISAGERPQT